VAEESTWLQIFLCSTIPSFTVGRLALLPQFSLTSRRKGTQEEKKNYTKGDASNPIHLPDANLGVQRIEWSAQVDSGHKSTLESKERFAHRSINSNTEETDKNSKRHRSEERKQERPWQGAAFHLKQQSFLLEISQVNS
jgi:hypothetical protein